MNITILASIGSQNLGDELILKNEINLFENNEKLFPLPDREGTKGWDFKVFSYDPVNPFFKKENVEYLEYFPVGIRNPKNIFRNMANFYTFIKTIKSSDYVLIGGGGLFYDWETNNSALNQWLLRSKIIKFFGKKLIFYGVSIDIRNKQNYNKIKNIFSGSHAIYVRDNYSSDFLNKFDIKSEIVKDVVFNDRIPPSQPSPLQEEGVNFLSPGGGKYPRNEGDRGIKKLNSKTFKLQDLENIDFKNKTIGLAFRYLDVPNYEEKVINLIKYILNKNPKKIIFLPHSFHKTDTKANDYLFLKKILNSPSLRGRGLGGGLTNSMIQTYEIYTKKELDLCLAQRFHSIILSKVYEIPYISFSYSRKTESI